MKDANNFSQNGAVPIVVFFSKVLPIVIDE